MAETITIPIATLNQLLSYDCKTGQLRWRRIGNLAFQTSAPDGYLRGRINRRLFLAHRVAYAMHHEKWPDGEIDHVNGNRADNRAVNLRDVTRNENFKNKGLAKNNKSGISGIHWNAPTNSWRVRIVVNKKAIHVGLFDNLEIAEKKLKIARLKHGFHVNHGSLR